MNDDDPSLPPPLAKSRNSLGRIVLLIVIVLVLVGGVVCGAFWLQQHGFNMPAQSADTSAIEGQMAALDRKLQALDARVDALASRVDEIAAAPTASPTDNSKTPSADAAHIQNEITELSTTVGKLQENLKQITSSTAATRTETITYLQLRDAAMSGHGFSHELTTFRSSVKNDNGFDDPIDKLTPFAEKGAASIPALREKLAGNIASVDRAIAKSQADSWWQRVLAELKGLVSIRPLHGGDATDTSLEKMQSALAEDNVGAALDEMKNLPGEARAALDEWKQQAEARRTINDALQALADHFTAAPARRDEP